VREFGYAEVRARGTRSSSTASRTASTPKARLLDVWMSHGDKVTKLRRGSPSWLERGLPIAGMFDDARRFYAVQFHPSDAHAQAARSTRGSCTRSAAATGTGTCPSSRRTHREDPRAVGGEEVSWPFRGVDSAVAAALIHKAIGDQLTCIFVDTGCCGSTRATGDGHFASTWREVTA